jgi:hypothetical protein
VYHQVPEILADPVRLTILVHLLGLGTPVLLGNPVLLGIPVILEHQQNLDAPVILEHRQYPERLRHLGNLESLENLENRRPLGNLGIPLQRYRPSKLLNR